MPLLRQFALMPVKPWATMVSILLFCWIHIRGFSRFDWGLPRVCLSASGIGNRVGTPFFALTALASAITHASDHHLGGNVVSFFHKAVQLEAAWGSSVFFPLLFILTGLTQVLYVLVARALGRDSECAVGFSGVIFALKVLCQSQLPGYEFVQVAGLTVPAAAAAWLELIAIQIFTPHASFVAHLSGIIAGLFVSFIIYFLVPVLSRNRAATPQRRPWRCSACTLQNSPYEDCCAACRTPKTRGHSQQGAAFADGILARLMQGDANVIYAIVSVLAGAMLVAAVLVN